MLNPLLHSGSTLKPSASHVQRVSGQLRVHPVQVIEKRGSGHGLPTVLTRQPKNPGDQGWQSDSFTQIVGLLKT